MSLIIRSSSIHAAGCYTTTPIVKGAIVDEYTGPRIHKDEADLKYENSPTTYLFGLGDGTMVIDGHCSSMFINHSCDPNCETEEIKGRVWITAIRDIAAGEELTYDYNLYDGDGYPAPCNCGSANCRKTMYSEDEIKRRKKVAARAAAREAEKAARKKTALSSDETSAPIAAADVPARPVKRASGRKSAPPPISPGHEASPAL